MKNEPFFRKRESFYIVKEERCEYDQSAGRLQTNIHSGRRSAFGILYNKR